MKNPSRPHERRKSVRLNSICPATYVRFDEQWKPCERRRSRSLDLSPDGVRLQSLFPVDTGELLGITLSLGDQSVSFRGKVIHVTRSKDQSFQFGISIQNIEKMDKIALTRFIYYFKPSKTR